MVVRIICVIMVMGLLQNLVLVPVTLLVGTRSRLVDLENLRTLICLEVMGVLAVRVRV